MKISRRLALHITDYDELVQLVDNPPDKKFGTYQYALQLFEQIYKQGEVYLNADDRTSFDIFCDGAPYTPELVKSVPIFREFILFIVADAEIQDGDLILEYPIGRWEIDSTFNY